MAGAACDFFLDLFFYRGIFVFYSKLELLLPTGFFLSDLLGFDSAG